jgi:ribose transport system substrate-binding protein
MKAASHKVITTASLFAAAALVAGFASGCSSAQGSSGKASKNYTIAFVTSNTTDPFYFSMLNGAEAEAKKLGVKLTWTGPETGGSNSTSQQVEIVDTLLADHPSALVLDPQNAVALEPAVRKFDAAGIPVITVDSALQDESLVVSQITSNDIQGGAGAAETIAKLAHYKGDVAELAVPPGSSAADQRTQGFLAQMKKYPNMKVVADEDDNDSPSLSETDAKNIILAHPNLVGIFGNDTYGAEGAGQAVVALGKKGKIFVAGYDAEPPEIQLLKQGVFAALVVQKPVIEGQDAVLYAYDALTGHKSKIQKSVVLSNVVATDQNASDPAVSQYFYDAKVGKV